MGIWQKETTGGHWSGVRGKNGESGRLQETQRWGAGVRVSGGCVDGRWMRQEGMGVSRKVAGVKSSGHGLVCGCTVVVLV